MASKAYGEGYEDGLNWDLDGFDSITEAAVKHDGWDESTINAMGRSRCAKAWGAPDEGDAWSEACADYNRGVVDAIADRARKVPQ